MIWTHNRSLAGQQGISSPVSLLAGLLAGLFSHLRTCEDSVKVLFRRQVYSNSSTGLEKSAHGVWNTPPSPIFGALVSPVKGLVGKEVFTFEKILLRRRGKLQCDKGIEDRVSSKI